MVGVLSWETSTKLVGGSFVGCFALHPILWGIVPLIFADKFNRLAKIRQIEFISRIVSTIHAVVVVIPTLYALAVEQDIWEEPLFTTSANIQFAGCIMAGYMLYDIVWMLIYGIGQPVDFVHHIATLSCLYIGIVQAELLFFGGSLVGFLEISTPFLNMSWHLMELKMETSIFNIINGVALVVAFFVFRVVVSSWFGVKMYNTLLADARATTVHWIAMALFATLCCLNYYWFNKLFRKFSQKIQEVLRQRGSTKQE